MHRKQRLVSRSDGADEPHAASLYTQRHQQAVGGAEERGEGGEGEVLGQGPRIGEVDGCPQCVREHVADLVRAVRPALLQGKLRQFSCIHSACSSQVKRYAQAGTRAGTPAARETFSDDAQHSSA